MISSEGFMPETNQKIGRLIYQIRQERGLTQAAFAKKLGIKTAIVNSMSQSADYQLKTIYDLEEILLRDISAK